MNSGFSEDGDRHSVDNHLDSLTRIPLVVHVSEDGLQRLHLDAIHYVVSFVASNLLLEAFDDPLHVFRGLLPDCGKLHLPSFRLN